MPSKSSIPRKGDYSYERSGAAADRAENSFMSAAAQRQSALLDESLSELERAGRLVDDLLVLARRQGDAPPVDEVDLDDVAALLTGQIAA